MAVPYPHLSKNSIKKKLLMSRCTKSMKRALLRVINIPGIKENFNRKSLFCKHQCGMIDK